MSVVSQTNHRRRALLLLALAYFILMCLPSLFSPPFWDAASGLFPAVIFLVVSNFDFTALLSLTNYHQGGPNTHSLSLGTSVYAGLIKLDFFNTIFVLPHVLNISLGLGAIWLFYKILKDKDVASLAIVFPVAYLATAPLFLAQASQIYLEVMSTFIAVWAGYLIQQSRFSLALCVAVVAVYVKESSAVIYIATVLAVIWGAWPLKKVRLQIGLTLVGTAAAVYYSFHRYLSSNLSQSNLDVTEVGNCFKSVIPAYVFAAPDIYVILFCAVALGIGIGGHKLFNNRRVAPQWLFHFALVGGFTALILVVLPIMKNMCVPLPRYYLCVLPSAIYVIWDALKNLKMHGLVFGMLILWNICNSNGRFYPQNFANSGAVAERSLEYFDLQKSDLDMLAYLDTVDPEIQVAHPHGLHYILRNPGLGYVTRARKKLVNLVFQNPDKTPGCFLYLYEYSALGHQSMARFAVENAETWTKTSVKSFKNGRYLTEVFLFAAKNGEKTLPCQVLIGSLGPTVRQL